MGRYCAAVDYASARALFAQDVASFGTMAKIVFGLDLQQANQWVSIWPSIRDIHDPCFTLLWRGNPTHTFAKEGVWGRFLCHQSNNCAFPLCRDS